MNPRRFASSQGLITLICCASAGVLAKADQTQADVANSDSSSNTNAPSLLTPASAEPVGESWNWHVQNTFIGDYHPSFPAKYSGPNSMQNRSERQETVSLDLFAGAKLWQGAEFHVDGLLWQGFGLSHTVGADGFPNAEAFRAGTQHPNVTFSRVFIRQTIGLGGETEIIPDDQLYLARELDVSRVTITAGKMSVVDVFDRNAYAADAKTQFVNWALATNPGWDYPADSLGYTTGMAIELNEKNWAVRYGFYQVPKVSNGLAMDKSYLQAWAMVTEFERRFSLGDHPGAVRALVYLNEAHMGSFQETINNPALGEDITRTREYRYKFGFGFNAEQELIKGVGVFARAGWNDGRTESWAYSDVDRSASAGVSVKGQFWSRPDDTLGMAGMLNGISSVHQAYFAAGGTGILAGDGALNYGWEKEVEAYYDFKIWKTLHAAFDYTFIDNPAFNRDRGPISVYTLRVHWEY